MQFAVLLLVCIVYLAILGGIAFAIYKVTHAITLAGLIILLGLIAPVHEAIFGYSEFKEFDKQHPGVQCEVEHHADGILVEGRPAKSPLDALNSDSLPGGFRFKELPRQMVDAMVPKPDAPLAEYVQFFRTTDTDPACTQRYDAAPSRPNCVGVTSSSSPKSSYAVTQYPDLRTGTTAMPLNDSWLAPIAGSYVRVRELQTSRIVAEAWSFAVPVKVVPGSFWYSKTNPAGGRPATLCVAP